MSLSPSTPRVAFVVPVHNVEAYLAACLDSVLAQTVREIEVICIDDASSDVSPAILQKYADRDPRVRLIRQTANYGMSTARNRGLDEVTATWTVFVDSDDLICRELAERCLLAAEKFSADVVFFGFRAFNDGESPDLSALSHGAHPAQREKLLAGKAFAWTKFTRTEFLRRNGIAYPPGLLMQDIPVHWRLVLESAAPVALDDQLVLYRQRQSSVSYLVNWRRADGFIVYDMVRDYLRQTGAWSSHERIFLLKELEMFADITTAFYNGNPGLLPRAQAEIMRRMTVSHWSALLEDRSLPVAKRDLLLSCCRPVGASRTPRQLLPMARHLMRRQARSVRKLARNLPAAFRPSLTKRD